MTKKILRKYKNNLPKMSYKLNFMNIQIIKNMIKNRIKLPLMKKKLKIEIKISILNYYMKMKVINRMTLKIFSNHKQAKNSNKINTY